MKTRCKVPVTTMAAMLMTIAMAACSATTPSTGDADGRYDADTQADAAADAPAQQAQAPRRAPPMSDPLPATAMTCDADKARTEMVGQPATEANVERARVASGAESVRVIRPGMMVTMEFVESRLNIDVDVDNVITGLRCG
ncbi:I78 family peptidase inhibitor [Marilutibacter maris]|uniref:Peptidase inhibitor I78 family protein n=1 Tax=Marilutibacter maris TaxID=1605891 RepID=A0A2U9TEC6_9GAMM|nr:I78 family peptidase inhibitor [Lysobacter maris]AWV08838.1 hypothetical protein C9I47_3174 [Lysobacter maris]